MDRSIITSSPKHDKLLNFYFDKFNVKKRDLNPFNSNLVVDLDQRKNYRSVRDEYSFKAKNLSRQTLNKQYNEKRYENIR